MRCEEEELVVEVEFVPGEERRSVPGEERRQKNVKQAKLERRNDAQKERGSSTFLIGRAGTRLATGTGRVAASRLLWPFP